MQGCSVQEMLSGGDSGEARFAQGRLPTKDNHCGHAARLTGQGQAGVSSWKSCRLTVILTITLALGLGAILPSAFGVESVPVPAWPASHPADRESLRSQLAEASQFLHAYSQAVRAAARLVGPSVVHIDAVGSPPTGGVAEPRRVQEESGAGVIIRLDAKDFVLTNRHVVSKASAENIKIRLYDGRVLRPTAVWTDRDTDIALLAVNAPDLEPAELGDSDEVDVGDFVIAIGSPFGLRHSVTFGIVSAVRRRGLQLGHAGLRVQDFIQTDAAINPGNSGGPLVNLKGQVIGINTAIASNSGGNEGIGFAVPINLALRVAQELAERGRVRWGYLGVNLDERFDAEKAGQLGLPYPRGALVTEVVPGSPAAAAGLKAGDVILRFDRFWVEDSDHLIFLVSVSPRNQPIPLLIWRNRQQVELSVQLGERPSS